ncbi:MAG: response regulator [Myxococcota bacterium]|nr:response regulator [Myxococcota bacterium]
MATTEIALRQPRIAVIDDRPLRVNVALRILAGARYRARGFTSPSEAIDVLCSTPFDAVLTDHRMGEHDAAWLCATLRRRLGLAAPPMVVVTRSIHDVAIPDRDLFAGILLKPLSPGGLLTSLQRALRGRAS